MNNISYTLVAVIVEPTEVAALVGTKTELKTVVYCFDKNRLPHKFLASQIERYD